MMMLLRRGEIEMACNGTKEEGEREVVEIEEEG